MTASTSLLPTPSRRRTTVTNLLFSYAGVLLLLVQGIVLVPLYLARIPVELYGAWLATGNVLAWIELVDPGVSTVLQQRVAQAFGARDRAGLGRIIGTGLALAGGLAFLPLLAWPIASALPGLIGYRGADAGQLVLAFRLAVAGTVVTLAAFAVGAVNAGLQLALAAGAVNLVAGLVGLAATVAGLFLGYGLASLPAGLALRGLVMLAGHSAMLLRWTGRNLGPLALSRDELRSTASLSGYLATSKLAGALVGKLDAVLVAAFLSPVQVVVYTMTGRAFEVVRMVCDRVSQSAAPAVAHLAGEERSERLWDAVERLRWALVALACVGIGSVLALDGAFVAVWVGPDLYGGDLLAALLAGAAVTGVLETWAYQMVMATGGIRSGAATALLHAAVKVPLEVALLWWLGLPGVALASALASLLVPLWRLPRLLEGEGGGLHRARVAWQLLLARLAAFGALGLLLARLVPTTWIAAGWTTFLPWAAAVGLLLSALVLATDGRARTEGRGLGRRLLAAVRG